MKKFKDSSKAIIIILGVIAGTATLTFSAFNIFATNNRVNSLHQDIIEIKHTVDNIYGILIAK